jgi:hypothetical protein
MSSPMVVTSQPSPPSARPAGGIGIAKLVLPQALGKAAATWNLRPCGLFTPSTSMCSASQPRPSLWAARRPIVEAMRSAKHFFPGSAFPP